MGKYLLSVLGIFLFFSMQVNAQTTMKPFIPYDGKGDAPEVPRVSVWEAYSKYKAGKAIILHAGGQAYRLRHIMGAFNLETYNDKLLLKFPKRGVEIFTYCY